MDIKMKDKDKNISLDDSVDVYPYIHSKMSGEINSREENGVEEIHGSTGARVGTNSAQRETSIACVYASPEMMIKQNSKDNKIQKIIKKFKRKK